MSKSNPYWAKLLLASFPLLHAGRSIDDVPDLDPEWSLWAEINEHAEDEDVDFVEACHLFLKDALGERRFKAARRSLDDGVWEARIQFMCRKMGLMMCRYHDQMAHHTLTQIDGQVRALLINESELARCLAVNHQRELAHLQAAEPYNRLPC